MKAKAKAAGLLTIDRFERGEWQSVPRSGDIVLTTARPRDFGHLVHRWSPTAHDANVLPSCSFSFTTALVLVCLAIP